ncbi:hypothetical protein R3P38DRAFT_3187502 [Favolaschia claudopus]|uniref:Uncharacterized protein n=1 Tax=Favolaschia claudopus TaxID=2862362 RepID=A0AAW0BZW6_9AGAR
MPPANAALDISSSGLCTRRPNPLLLPLPPPRRAAALFPQHDVSTSRERDSKIWPPAGWYRPQRVQQQIPRAPINFLAVAVAADAPRSGAIALTRPIDVPRAGLPLRIQNFPLRGIHHQHQVPKSKCDFEASGERRFHLVLRQKSFFPLRGRHHHQPNPNQNSIFPCPPSDACSTFPPRPAHFLTNPKCPENFLPAARALHRLQSLKSKFEISRSRERGLELYVVQIFFFPLRGAQLLKLFNSRVSI